MQTQLKDATTEFKNQLSNHLLLFGVIAGYLTVLLMVFVSEYYLFTPSFYLDLSGMVLLSLLYYFRDRIDLTIRTSAIIFILYLITQTNLIQYGVVSPLKLFFALIPFLTILVFDLRKSFIFFFFVVINFGVTAYLFITERIEPLIQNPINTSVSLWVTYGIIIVLTGLIIMIFVDRYNEKLNQIFSDLLVKTDELTKRDELLQENLREKNVLLQEIHHRVKNNLAIVSGLLELQSLKEKDKTIQNTLKKSTNRIMSIAKVHQFLYQSESFDKIPFKMYIDQLAEVILSTMNSDQKQITFNSNISVDYLNINNGVPLGIIVNELITNSIKYGFPDDDGNEISISISETDNRIVFNYRDNGVGIADFESASSKSLGFSLINSLLTQIQATSNYHTEEHFELSFSYPKISD